MVGMLFRFKLRETRCRFGERPDDLPEEFPKSRERVSYIICIKPCLDQRLARIISAAACISSRLGGASWACCSMWGLEDCSVLRISTFPANLLSD